MLIGGKKDKHLRNLKGEVSKGAKQWFSVTLKIHQGEILNVCFKVLARGWGMTL